MCDVWGDFLWSQLVWEGGVGNALYHPHHSLQATSIISCDAGKSHHAANRSWSAGDDRGKCALTSSGIKASVGPSPPDGRCVCST